MYSTVQCTVQVHPTELHRISDCFQKQVLPVLNNFFLIDNNGTDCGRDKEEEIYITSASVIELECKKYADNDSYDSGIYNASTNTGNN